MDEDRFDEFLRELANIEVAISNLSDSSKHLIEEDRFQRQLKIQNDWHRELLSTQNSFNSKNINLQKKLLDEQKELVKEQKKLVSWTQVLAIATIILALGTLLTINVQILS